MSDALPLYDELDMALMHAFAYGAGFVADADSSFRVLCCCRHAAGSVDPGFSFAANFLAPSLLIRMTPSTTGLSRGGEHWGVPTPCLGAQFPGCLRRERGRSRALGRPGIAAGQRGASFYITHRRREP